MVTKKIAIIATLSDYSLDKLKSDLFAGITVGTILIPQGMAYALLAGMPPIYGLYASIVPLIIYACFASSSKLSVGPVAVSALLVLAGISQLAEPFSAEYIELVILTGFLVGLVQISLGMFKMGFLVNFISHPVIAGFTSAAAIIIIVSQLKDALGLQMTNSPNCLSTLSEVASQLGQTNWITAGITLISITVITVLKKINKAIPGPLIVAAIGIILSYYFSLGTKEVAIVGQIPEGLPKFSNPSFSLDALSKLWPTVLTVTLIGIVESLGIAKSLEARFKDHTIVPNQELIALGLSKVTGSFFSALPSSGSFSRSAINGEAGGKTTVSSLITAILVILTLIFFTTVFYHLPKAILAAIILLSVVKLFDIKEAKALWKSDRLDFWMMFSTFIVTLFLGIEAGVLSGVLLSILAVLYKSSVPAISELGHIEGTSYYKNIERFDEASGVDDTLILRFESKLFFGNANFFKDSIMKRIHNGDNQISHVVIDGSIINDVDSTAKHMLRDLDRELEDQGVSLHLCGLVGQVRDSLYRSGLLTEIEKHHMTIHDAIVQIRHSEEHEVLCRSGNPLQTNETRNSK